MEFSVMALADKVTTEADAYRFIEDLRWNGTPTCPFCGATERISFITPKNGVSRTTRTGSKSERRVWFCGVERRQFTVLVGTIFHGTKVPLRKWLFVVYEMCANKNGIAAREIERKYEVSAKTAWFMTQRIREAMKRSPFADAMRGEIVADETWIGGRMKFTPGAEKVPQGTQIVPGGKKRYAQNRNANKTAVVTLIDKGTGEARSKVIPNVTGATLAKALAENVDIPVSTLYTDESKSYTAVGREFVEHLAVNHSEDEYVRYEPSGRVITSNAAENFFSQLKRSIDGTHHRISAEHLPRYLAEFDYRYSTRRLSDDARTKRLFGQVGGRRLTYRPLIGG